MTREEILARIEAFKTRLEAVATAYPTVDAVLGRIRELDIKGERRSEQRCIIARFLEHELGVSIMTSGADFPVPDVSYEDIQYTGLQTGLRWVDSPPQFYLVARRFDDGNYPDLEE